MAQDADAKKEVADLEQQIEKAAAAEPVTAESAGSQAEATEAQVAEDAADSRPASLKKSQDAAAARSKGEEIGDTGQRFLLDLCRIQKPRKFCYFIRCCFCSW